MHRMRKRLYWVPFSVLVATLLLPFLQGQVRNTRNPSAEWPMYNRDLGGTRFSPLAQINTKNVNRLTQAWTYKVGKVKAEGIVNLKSPNPLNRRQLQLRRGR